MKQARSIRSAVVILAVLAAASAAVLACESETGPDAPARTNGCIDTGCTSQPPVTPLEKPKDGGSD